MKSKKAPPSKPLPLEKDSSILFPVNTSGSSPSLSIQAKPNAKKTALLSINEGILAISIHAPPSEGEANRELIFFLSKLFHLPQKNVQITRGLSSKRKTVTLQGISEKEIHDYLQASLLKI